MSKNRSMLDWLCCKRYWAELLLG